MPAETVDLDSIAGEIGRIARGLLALHVALDRSGHGDEAALAAMLHDALDRRHSDLIAEHYEARGRMRWQGFCCVR